MSKDVPLVEKAEDAEELAPFDALMDNMKHCEYLIRVLFNKDFFTAETTNKREIQDKISKLKLEGEVSEQFSAKEKQEIKEEGYKLDCLLAAVEFLRDNVVSKRDTVLESGELAGWEKLSEEDWREEFLEKTSKCGKFQAKEALKKTSNLREAIRIAPTLALELPKFGDKPAPADLGATLQRAKKEVGRNF